MASLQFRIKSKVKNKNPIEFFKNNQKNKQKMNIIDVFVKIGMPMVKIYNLMYQNFK